MTIANQHPTKHDTEAICPPHCAGHGASYQTWEDADSGPFRTHASVAMGEALRSSLAHPMFFTKGSASVEVTQIETSDSMTAAAVSLVLGEDSLDVTPTQARQFAARILEAASMAEGVTLAVEVTGSSEMTTDDRERNAFEIGRDYERSHDGSEILRLDKPADIDATTWAAIKQQVRAFVGDRMEEL